MKFCQSGLTLLFVLSATVVAQNANDVNVAAAPIVDESTELVPSIFELVTCEDVRSGNSSVVNSDGRVLAFDEPRTENVAYRQRFDSVVASREELHFEAGASSNLTPNEKSGWSLRLNGSGDLLNESGKVLMEKMCPPGALEMGLDTILECNKNDSYLFFYSNGAACGAVRFTQKCAQTFYPLVKVDGDSDCTEEEMVVVSEYPSADIDRKPKYYRPKKLPIRTVPLKGLANGIQSVTSYYDPSLTPSDQQLEGIISDIIVPSISNIFTKLGIDKIINKVIEMIQSALDQVKDMVTNVLGGKKTVQSEQTQMTQGVLDMIPSAISRAISVITGFLKMFTGNDDSTLSKLLTAFSQLGEHSMGLLKSLMDIVTNIVSLVGWLLPTPFKIMSAPEELTTAFPVQAENDVLTSLLSEASYLMLFPSGVSVTGVAVENEDSSPPLSIYSSDGSIIGTAAPVSEVTSDDLVVEVFAPNVRSLLGLGINKADSSLLSAGSVSDDHPVAVGGLVIPSDTVGIEPDVLPVYIMNRGDHFYIGQDYIRMTDYDTETHQISQYSPASEMFKTIEKYGSAAVIFGLDRNFAVDVGVGVYHSGRVLADNGMSFDELHLSVDPNGDEELYTESIESEQTEEIWAPEYEYEGAEEVEFRNFLNVDRINSIRYKNKGSRKERLSAYNLSAELTGASRFSAESRHAFLSNDSSALDESVGEAFMSFERLQTDIAHQLVKQMKLEYSSIYVDNVSTHFGWDASQATSDNVETLVANSVSSLDKFTSIFNDSIEHRLMSIASTTTDEPSSDEEGRSSSASSGESYAGYLPIGATFGEAEPLWTPVGSIDSLSNDSPEAFNEEQMSNYSTAVPANNDLLGWFGCGCNCASKPCGWGPNWFCKKNCCGSVNYVTLPPQTTVIQQSPPNIIQAPAPQIVQAPPPQIVQAAPPQIVQAAPQQIVQAAPPGVCYDYGMAANQYANTNGFLSCFSQSTAVRPVQGVASFAPCYSYGLASSCPATQMMMPQSAPMMMPQLAPMMMPQSAPMMIPQSAPMMIPQSAPMMMPQSAPMMTQRPISPMMIQSAPVQSCAPNVPQYVQTAPQYVQRPPQYVQTVPQCTAPPQYVQTVPQCTAPPQYVHMVPQCTKPPQYVQSVTPCPTNRPQYVQNAPAPVVTQTIVYRKAPSTCVDCLTAKASCKGKSCGKGCGCGKSLLQADESTPELPYEVTSIALNRIDQSKWVSYVDSAEVLMQCKLIPTTRRLSDKTDELREWYRARVQRANAVLTGPTESGSVMRRNQALDNSVVPMDLSQGVVSNGNTYVTFNGDTTNQIFIVQSGEAFVPGAASSSAKPSERPDESGQPQTSTTTTTTSAPVFVIPTIEVTPTFTSTIPVTEVPVVITTTPLMSTTTTTTTTSTTLPVTTSVANYTSTSVLPAATPLPITTPEEEAVNRLYDLELEIKVFNKITMGFTVNGLTGEVIKRTAVENIYSDETPTSTAYVELMVGAVLDCTQSIKLNEDGQLVFMCRYDSYMVWDKSQ